MAIALAVACSKGITDSPDPTPTPPDPVPPITSTDSIVTVSFTTGGEVVIGEEPLTKSIATSPNDLWGFQVYQFLDSIKRYEDAGKGVIYASGYYDCLDSIKMPLVKGKWYAFTLTYIPNGKNVIDFSRERYGLPFNNLNDTKNLNVMYYSKYMTGLTTGAITPVGDGRFTAKYFSSVERYQGTKWNVQATDNTTTIGINLYRMMTGVKIEAEDFTSGTIYVKGGERTSDKCVEHKLVPVMDTIINTRDTVMQDGTEVTLRDTIIQVAQKSILDIIVQTPRMPVSETTYSLLSYTGFADKIMAEQPFPDEQEGVLQVIYKDTTGVEISIYTNTKFEFKRLTKHVIKFNVAKILNQEAGFEPEVKDDPLTSMPEEEVPLE